MVRFCDNCSNILFINTENEVLTFKCNACKLKHKPNPDDTLIYEESNINDKSRYDIFIKNAANDRSNPKIAKTCPKCARTIVRYIRLGENSKAIYVCKCGNVF